MEFFEALKTFIIATRSSESGFEEIAGTQLSDEYFAYKDDGKTLHPEARWIISDIKSGKALPSKETKGALLRFATLKDCREWLKDMPEEYKQKIDEVRATTEYASACQKLEEFKKGLIKTESLDFMEAFEALSEIYAESLEQDSIFEF